jgi:hypothetical protein
MADGHGAGHLVLMVKYSALQEVGQMSFLNSLSNCKATLRKRSIKVGWDSRKPTRVGLQIIHY